MRISSTEAKKGNQGAVAPSLAPLLSVASVQDHSFCAVGIDVGGTKIAAGVVGFPECKMYARRQIPTEAKRGGAAVLADVEQLVRELMEESSALNLRVDGIGLGLCELVNLAGEPASENCIAWKGLPVRERLSRLAPATIEADVRAAALGESLFGAGRPFRIFLYVTVGTGISSCLMIDGHPFLGARGATGTMASGPLPSAGGRSNALMPTLEELSSGPALVRCFNHSGGRAASGHDVLVAVAAGDDRAVGVVRSAGEALGAAIGWLVNVLDPEGVVIGGGLGLSDGLYREATIASTRRHIWSELHRGLPVLPAALGLDAGAIGAASVAWKKFGKQH